MTKDTPMNATNSIIVEKYDPIGAGWSDDISRMKNVIFSRK